MKEADLKTELVAAFRLKYPHAMVLRFGGGLYMARGIPDLFVQIPGGVPPFPGTPATSFWIEAKMEGNKLSPGQAVLCRQLAMAGGIVFVATLRTDSEGQRWLFIDDFLPSGELAGPNAQRRMRRHGSNSRESRWPVDQFVARAREMQLA